MVRLAGPVDFKSENFPVESRTGGTVLGLRLVRFFNSSWLGTRDTLFRFCWYRAIASGVIRNVGNAIFGRFVVDRSLAGSLVCSSFVLLISARIRSFTVRFGSANGDKSVCDVSDSGCGEVNNI